MAHRSVLLETAMSFVPIDQALEAAPRMDAAWLDAHWMPFTANRNFKPDQLYAAYDLALDTVGRRALYKAGMSRPEIDAVIFRSTERNWPDGIDSFEKRYPMLEKFKKYHAYLGARWDDKVLLIVPVEKNRRMPVLMRPFVDLYFIYTATGVEVRGKK